MLIIAFRYGTAQFKLLHNVAIQHLPFPYLTKSQPLHISIHLNSHIPLIPIHLTYRHSLIPISIIQVTVDDRYRRPNGFEFIVKTLHTAFVVSSFLLNCVSDYKAKDGLKVSIRWVRNF